MSTSNNAPEKPKYPALADLMAWAGIARGTYGQTPGEVEQTVRELPSEWERVDVLVDQITPDNLPDSSDDAPVGNEVW